MSSVGDCVGCGVGPVGAGVGGTVGTAVGDGVGVLVGAGESVLLKMVRKCVGSLSHEPSSFLMISSVWSSSRSRPER